MSLDLLDEALKQQPGGDRKSERINVSNIHDDRPAGTTERAALRRLRKDRPDLHRKVLAGELSAHGAAVQAGFRPRTVTVRVDDPGARSGLC